MDTATGPPPKPSQGLRGRWPATADTAGTETNTRDRIERSGPVRKRPKAHTADRGVARERRDQCVASTLIALAGHVVSGAIDSQAGLGAGLRLPRLRPTPWQRLHDTPS